MIVMIVDMLGVFCMSDVHVYSYCVFIYSEKRKADD